VIVASLVLIACVEPPDDSVYGEPERPDNPAQEEVEDPSDGSTDDTREAQPEPQPALELDTEWLDFGELVAGEQQVLEVALSNVGTEPVEVFEVNLPSGPWTGPKALPWTLYPDDTHDFLIAYEPDEAGEHGGVVEFVTDHPEVPTYQVAVEGSAVEACEICAPRLETTGLSDFMSLLGWEHTQTLSLENTGDEPLTVTDVYVFNDQSGGDFWAVWNGERTLQPGDGIQVEVGYQSDVVSYDSANYATDENVLHVLSNDPTEGDLQIGLYGLGAS